MTRAFVFDPPYIKRGSGRIDWWGIGLLGLGVGALQILLDKGQQEDWFSSSLITTMLVLSAVGLLLFIVRELQAKSPVVNLRVFLDRTYATGTFLMTVVGFVLYGSLVLLPIWMQTLLGYPSLQAGIALAPRGMGSFLTMPLVGVLMGKRDPRKFLATGMVLASLTLFGFGRLNLNAGYWDFFWPQFIQGIALALLFVPLTTVTMGNISREQMGNATSIFNLLRNIGGSIGIASVTTLVARYQQVHINYLGEHVTPYSLGSQNILNSAGKSLEGLRKGHAALFGMVQQQAAILSFLDVFLILGACFLFLVPLILLMKRPPRGGPAAAAH
jgi:MFS transporter, DHA2 family, multidrug resistance protein